MKIFAFYLPQFHAIPENDNWWGEGFTEWVNVKKAQSLFKGHYQPKIPLDENYYDLSQVETLEWQAKLMHEYKIDGLCFYHYWFAGKQLLEKPAEILLENKDINMPFFFSWANEPWTRTWDGGHKNVLMDQKYGGKKEWIEHFNYLRPFFEDDRYEKYNGKPIFLIYRSESFENCQEWMDCWKEEALKANLKGIHFVSMQTSFPNDEREIKFDAVVNFEPMNTIFHFVKKSNFEKTIKLVIKGLKRFSNNMFNTTYVEKIEDYNEVWNSILEKHIDETIYAGAFVSWDNSARKGTKSLVITGSNPEKFSSNFKKLYKKAKENKVPYIFINAWNEWAEGTYLEPDHLNKFEYLQSIKEIHGKNQ